MQDRKDMLRQLASLGFDTSQCEDMSDERLAGWIDECEIIAYRGHIGHLPASGDAPCDVVFDQAWMDNAFEAAHWLIDQHGDDASNVVLKEVAALANRGDSTGLRRCGAVLQALRDLAAAKEPRH